MPIGFYPAHAAIKTIWVYVCFLVGNKNITYAWRVIIWRRACFASPGIPFRCSSCGGSSQGWSSSLSNRICLVKSRWAFLGRICCVFDSFQGSPCQTTLLDRFSEFCLSFGSSEGSVFFFLTRRKTGGGPSRLDHWQAETTK